MISKKNKHVSKKVIKEDRRTFIKKAVYTAPKLLALGALVRPTKSKAAVDDNEIGSWDPGPEFPL